MAAWGVPSYMPSFSAWCIAGVISIIVLLFFMAILVLWNPFICSDTARPVHSFPAGNHFPYQQVKAIAILSFWRCVCTQVFSGWYCSSWNILVHIFLSSFSALRYVYGHRRLTKACYFEGMTIHIHRRAHQLLYKLQRAWNVLAVPFCLCMEMVPSCSLVFLSSNADVVTTIKENNRHHGSNCAPTGEVSLFYFSRGAVSSEYFYFSIAGLIRHRNFIVLGIIAENFMVAVLYY